MKIIDIDNITLIDSHIHYRKEYEGSAVLMDKMSKIIRNNIKFSIEYKPIGDPDIKVVFPESPNFPTTELIPKLKEKIHKMDQNGTLAALHKK
jgi:hypothetical protein